MRVVGVLVGAIAVGWALAWSWDRFPVHAGAVGAVAMLAAAFHMRRHWAARRRTVGDDPGARERHAWHSLVGLGLICGHLMGSLLSGLDLRVGSGNTLAIDNWILIVGAAAAWLVLRPKEMERDERDIKLANRGAHAGLAAMTGILVLLLLLLGFAPPAVADRLDPFTLGNVLVVVILVAWLARYATQLIGYWAASRPGRHDV